MPAVVGAIAESLKMKSNEPDWHKLKLQMLLTAGQTRKNYNVTFRGL